VTDWITDALDVPHAIRALRHGALDCCDRITVQLVLAGLDVKDEGLARLPGFEQRSKALLV